MHAGPPRHEASVLLQEAARLLDAGEPFALATVVRCERPASARPGDRALVRRDGTLEGWVGGSCAQPVVVREALHALADGEPRLLRLAKEIPSGSRRVDGVLEFLMTCHSGGTLEIYVEPHLPAPELVVVGDTPVARSLVALGGPMGYRLVTGERFPDRVASPARAFVVVATQGNGDEEALEAALRLDPAPAYVGLVASRRRAEAVRDYLRHAGVETERIAAVKAPAGLDLGAETPEEIALSVLAELLLVRRREHRGAGLGAPAAAGVETGRPDEAIDPVCGMTVEPATAVHTVSVGETTYYFCGAGCRARFVKNPAAYASA